MTFALLGYGKMGRQIEKLLLEAGHRIVATIDNEDDWAAKMNAFRTADVAIDFSMPSVAVPNMRRCFENHIPVVVGTTGWMDQLSEMVDLCRQHDGSLIYGSNFSVGANIFVHLNRQLAEWMNHEEQYSAILEETHHTAKKDAPSGTAITLAKALLNEVERYSQWQLSAGEQVADNILPVQAHRIGNVHGIHQIVWHSEEDDVEIKHTAHSRIGFAKGAIKAAIWLTAHPGIYDFQTIALSL